MTNTEISGEQIAKWLRKGEKSDHPGKKNEVVGPVQLGGERLNRPPSLEGFLFLDDVDLSETTIPGPLNLSKCLFQKRLLLRNARLDGELNLDDSEIFGKGWVYGGKRIGLDLTGARIRGGVTARRLELREVDDEVRSVVVDVSDVSIGQSFLLNGSRLPELRGSNATIGGNLDLGAHVRGTGEEVTPTRIGNADLGGLKLRGLLQVGGAKIDNELSLASARVGQLSAVPVGQFRTEIGNFDGRNLHVSGTLQLSGVKIEKQLFLGFARLRELWVVPGEEFRPEIGTVHLSEVQGSPWVAFEGLICPGEVRIIAADLGPTAFRLGKVGAALQACCIGHLMLEATKIAGRLDLTHIQVTGTGAMREGVWINTCRVEEGVRFWDEKWTERWENDKALGIRSWDHGAAVHGPVTIMNTTIGTSCDLTFLKAGGKVVIEGCTIGAHLRALSLVTLREELSEVEKSELDSKLRTEIGIAQDASTFRTIAAELRLVGTTVSHDVDLTGLTLMASSDASPQHGNVEARHLTVMGDIKAYATTEDKKNVHAVIPGHLNLADAEARRLTVSGHSFAAKKRSQEPEKNRFILTSGRFGTVFFPYFKRHNGEEPVPTDLADVDVRTWILDDVPDGKEPSEKDYKALLSTDRTFRRSTYRSMEANRRDRGYEEHADGIYREMHLRERREGFLQPDTHGNWLNRWYETLLNSYETLLRTPVTTTLTKILVWLCLTHWWRIGEPLLWNVVWRGLLRFGTDPKPLILVIFSLSAISLPVYRCADNMAPSPAFLAMHPEWAGAEDRPHAPPRRHPAQWSDWDTVAMTLRHHVPLAELGLREEWNLSTEAPLKYGPIALPVSPEDWGGFMTLVNIPMWAILVGFALRKFLRESRSEAG